LLCVPISGASAGRRQRCVAARFSSTTEGCRRPSPFRAGYGETRNVQPPTLKNAWRLEFGGWELGTQLTTIGARMLSTIRDAVSAVLLAVIHCGFTRDNSHSTREPCFVQRFIRCAHHQRGRLRVFFPCAAHRHQLTC